MHKQRVLTALVIIPLVLIGLLWGGTVFFNVLVFVVAFFCLYEYFSMTFQNSPLLQSLGVLLGLIPLFMAMFKPGDHNIVFALFLICVSSIIIFLMTYPRHKNPFSKMAIFLFGCLYIGLFASLIVLIHPMPYGRLWIIFLLVIVAAADTGAYYIGSAMGRHKLCPNISRGKTVEGAVGGLIACVLMAVFSWMVFMDFSDLRALVPLAVLLGVASQIGDLTESVIKRACGRKDSGRLLPGHGGVFDRVDGLLMAGPCLFWILHFLGDYRGIG